MYVKLIQSGVSIFFSEKNITTYTVCAIKVSGEIQKKSFQYIYWLFEKPLLDGVVILKSTNHNLHKEKFDGTFIIFFVLKKYKGINFIL